jgi:hypothetical protein
VDDVTAVILILLENNPKDKSWGGAQKMMNNVDKFLERLKGFKAVIDEGSLARKTVDATRSYLALPHFNKWAAGAGWGGWTAGWLEMAGWLDVGAGGAGRRAGLPQPVGQCAELGSWG